MNNFEPRYIKLAAHYLDEKLQALQKPTKESSLLKSVLKKFTKNSST